MNEETREQSQELEKIDLIRLVGALLRLARHFVLLAVVLVVLFAALLCLNTRRTYTPQYQASASFTVTLANPLYAEQQYYNTSAAEQMAKTFPYILTSGVLSKQVTDALGIAAMPSVTATALGSTNIITLTVTAGDPQLAYDVLCCVIERYPDVAEFVVGATRLTLLSESGVPGGPINTLQYKTAVLQGVVLGLGLWCGILLLYWWTHQTVHDEGELHKLVNLPCLGRLPVVQGYGKRGKNECPIVSDKNDKFGFNESVRLLRVRAERELDKTGGKVLLVTSSIANEGKTTTSINLATALAQRGKKTLLVDCDLRNPSVAATLGQSGKKGLSEYLRGECSLDNVLFRVGSKELYVVFGGEAMAEPEGLMGQKPMKDLMRAMRRSVDYIILDTPPCALMADAAELASFADGILLTVRQDFACRQQILEGVQLLSDSGKPILGCVLNMTAPKRSSGGYSYYGYYGQYGKRGAREEPELVAE